MLFRDDAKLYFTRVVAQYLELVGGVFVLKWLGASSLNMNPVDIPIPKTCCGST